MNVFVIAAPYQILNSIEAIQRMRLADNALIVLDTGLFQRNTYERMIDTESWQSVQFVPFKYRLTDHDFGKNFPTNLYERLLELYLVLDQMLKRWRINRLCASVGYAEKLFLGNYLNDYDLHMRHVANGISHERLFLLDVGTDTLRIARQRLQEQHDKSPEALAEKLPAQVAESGSGAWITKFKRTVRDRFVNWTVGGVPSLTFFTCYEPEVHPRDEVIANDYRCLRSRIQNVSRVDVVFFVGQPLVDQQYVRLETFVRHMRRIVDYFSGRRLVYVPHPRESEHYVQLVQTELGLPMQRFAVPIEYAITLGEEAPRGVASFFSSALVNLASMLGNHVELTAFYIPQEDLLKQVEVVEHTYQQIRSVKGANIKVA
ncbi:MAG: polysialyltransferase family glycosyltransferase [Nitrospira sp.]